MRNRRRGDQGMVTVEAAIAILCLVLLAAALVEVVGAGARHLRAGDAARTAARILARGQDEATAIAAALQVAPEAAVSVGVEGEFAVAEVSIPLDLLVLQGRTAHARVVVAVEDTP